jgi:hypothetical protein
MGARSAAMCLRSVYNFRLQSCYSGTAPVLDAACNNPCPFVQTICALPSKLDCLSTGGSRHHNAANVGAKSAAASSARGLSLFACNLHDQ